MKYDAKSVSKMLVDRVDAVCRFLLPNGRPVNGEWTAGDVAGSAGNSLKVRLTGEKAGIWADFASNGADRGDLLDLWQLSKGVSFIEAFKQAKQFLGIKEAEYANPAKSYSKPRRDGVRGMSPIGPVKAYLTFKRKLSPATLEAFKIAQKGEDGIVFPSLSPEGELLFLKTLKVDRVDGKKVTWVEKGCAPALFGWQAVPKTAREVIICEGEIDAMSWLQYGFPALSVPFGAGGGAKADWIDYEWENLEPFETIYLAYDNDDAGQACMEEIASRLGIQRCRVVKTPRKDCNECLTAGVPEKEMARCIASAQWIERPEVSRPTEFSAEVRNLFDLTIPPAGFACSQLRESLRFRPRETTIWTGISGHGKSTILSHIMMEAVDNGFKVGVASLEIPPANTLAIMGRQLYGRQGLKPSEVDAFLEWLSGKLWIFNIVGSTERSKLMELLLYARARHNIDHFVIDSLMKLDLSGEDYDAQRAFLNDLTGFAIKTGCHVHLVAHPRKGSDEAARPGKLDIKGSSDIFNQVDNVVSVWRNKAKEDRRTTGKAEESEPDSIIYCDKQRLTGWEGSTRLWFDANSRQFRANYTENPKIYISALPSLEEIVSGMPELPPDPRMSDA